MKNQLSISSSSSSSSHKHDQKLKSVVVAEEEKETMNNPEQKSPQEIVSERTVLDERPSSRLGVGRMERDTMKIFLPKDKKNHKCNFCPREFPSLFPLYCHETSHIKDRELEKRRKMIESMRSDDIHLVPFDSYQGLSFGPFKYGGGGHSRSAYPFSNDGGVTEMKATIFPPQTLDGFLTGNTSYSSSSRYPLPSNNYSAHAL